MLNKPKKLCKDCGKNEPHPWRKICLPCINRIAKEKAREQQKKQKEKIVVRKQKAKVKKAFSRSHLTKEADRVFSIFIRERDRGNPCITCKAEWEEWQNCWHFMSRRHLNTRWHEKNANWQCQRCNNWNSWEQFLHSLFIDRLYGKWTAEQIMRLAQDTSKTTDEEILMHIRYYYGELAKMAIDYKPKKIYLHE